MDKTLQIIFQYTPNRPEPILPADFFPFGIGSAVVGNTHFVNADVRYACDLCRYFRLKAKAFFFQGNVFEDVCTEKLVASFHVGKVEVGEHVGKHGEKFISKRVPVK